jgi:hypothetical protein
MVKFFKASCPSCFDIGKPITDDLNGVLSFLVCVVFELPMDEGLVECKLGSAVGELVLDEPFERPQIIDSFGGHRFFPLVHFRISSASGNRQRKKEAQRAALSQPEME